MKPLFTFLICALQAFILPLAIFSQANSQTNSLNPTPNLIKKQINPPTSTSDSIQKSPITESINTSSFETVTGQADRQVIDQKTSFSQEKMSLSQVYLKMGHRFLREKKLDKAQEYYEKSVNESEGNASQRARLALISLRASMGEDSLASEVANFKESDKAEAYFMMADGWESYYLENPSKVKFLELSREYYILLALRYSNSKWSQKTRLKLASLYIKEKKYDFALDHLLPLLQKSQEVMQQMEKDSASTNNNKKKSEELGLDMAWFLLGRVLEESNQHKDYDRAIKSYTNVLNFPQSPFLKASESRIRYIKRLFLNK